MTVAISLSSVRHSFVASEGDAVQAVADFTLDIDEGEFIAIVGPSGCGKTTVLNIVAGLEQQVSGSVSVFGATPRAGRPEVGYVLARDSLLPWRTSQKNAELGLEMHSPMPKQARAQIARDALVAMGLEAFTKAYPAQLSQGMRQRVALARAFAMKPAVLLMDEPFSALDAQTRMVVHEQFLGAWESQQSTVVLVTHDLAEAVTLADRVVIMTRRPGAIKAIHRVDLPRPRSAIDLQGDDRFHSLYEALWRDLEAEVRASGAHNSRIGAVNE